MKWITVALALLLACNRPDDVVLDAPIVDALDAASARPHVVMAIGDSITLGAPGEIGGFREPIHQAFPDLVFVGPLESVGRHAGENGKRIDQIRTLVLPSVASDAPDTILLLAGTNDILQGQDAASTATELAVFAEELRSMPSVRWVLASRITFLAGAFRDVAAAYNADLLDAFSAVSPGILLIDATSTVSFPSDFADAYHPNAVGYDKIATGWKTALSAL